MNDVVNRDATLFRASGVIAEIASQSRDVSVAFNEEGIDTENMSSCEAYNFLIAHAAFISGRAFLEFQMVKGYPESFDLFMAHLRRAIVSYCDFVEKSARKEKRRKNRKPSEGPSPSLGA